MLGNPLKDVFGIAPADTALVGCGRAGASTAFGYFAMQTAQNLALPTGKNYLDINAFAEEEPDQDKKEKELSSVGKSSPEPITTIEGQRVRSKRETEEAISPPAAAAV